MSHTRRTWATVDLSAAKENIKKIRNIVGDDCAIMSVVKADGYGHGAVEISKAIDENTDYFAVSN
ncbi:MAG: alanine racemase, partial [Ruminococcaceae bacterium]|nr:alanine racemase [Oscillospiraceae bacterium]